MTARDDFDRHLAAWLADDAPPTEPGHLLGQVLARTARTPRRPAWRIPERWIPMSVLTSRIATPSGLPVRAAVLIALLLIALVVGVAVVGSQRHALPAPFGPAVNGRIAYSVNGDIVSSDGPDAPATTIIGGATTDGLPWFSPDGTHFAFVRGDPSQAAELWSARADGSDQRKLTDIDSVNWVEWSPQGNVLAVTSDADPSILLMVRADGSGTTVIQTGLDEISRPAFRPPDGQRIALRARDADRVWGIYLLDRDGGHQTRLALDPGFQTDPDYATNSEYYFQSPAWSADGTRLYYHTLEPAPGSPAGPGFRIHIAEIDPTGAITSERIREFDAATDDEFDATPLPTGSSFVFQTIEGIEHRLWLGDGASNAPARDLGLAVNAGIDFQVSPDGRQVIASYRPNATSDPVVKAIDLAPGGTVTPAVVSEDFTWQRVAP